MIYYIYDEVGLIRMVRSRNEAKHLVSCRPDWKIVAKRLPKVIYEDCPF